MKLYKVVAKPTVLYGSGTWVTTKRDVIGLEAAEMRLLRSVKGYTRLVKIRTDVRTKYKQNWINHLERTDSTRLLKHGLNYKPR
jgi:hypothetical protein